MTTWMTTSTRRRTRGRTASRGPPPATTTAPPTGSTRSSGAKTASPAECTGTWTLASRCRRSSTTPTARASTCKPPTCPRTRWRCRRPGTAIRTSSRKSDRNTLVSQRRGPCWSPGSTNTRNERHPATQVTPEVCVCHRRLYRNTDLGRDEDAKMWTQNTHLLV